VLSLVPGALISSHSNPQETAIVHNANRIGAHVLRRIVGLALLGWPRVGSAQGTWSVISLPTANPTKVGRVAGIAVDPAGNL
jgi:hypothetical protein